MSEKLGQEKAVTITLIVPMFAILRDTVLKIDIQTDSNTIKEMKKHMLHKLSTRYSELRRNILQVLHIWIQDSNQQLTLILPTSNPQ